MLDLEQGGSPLDHGHGLAWPKEAYPTPNTAQRQTGGNSERPHSQASERWNGALKLEITDPMNRTADRHSQRILDRALMVVVLPGRYL